MLLGAPTASVAFWTTAVWTPFGGQMNWPRMVGVAFKPWHLAAPGWWSDSGAVSRSTQTVAQTDRELGRELGTRRPHQRCVCHTNHIPCASDAEGGEVVVLRQTCGISLEIRDTVSSEDQSSELRGD